MPIRTDGNKIIYNDDPLVYVIEDFITDEECQHFVNASNSKLERAKTIGGKDGIYHENRTGSNCWIAHNHSEVTTNLGQRIADLVGFPLKNAESFQVVYYTGGALNTMIIMMLLITKQKKEGNTLKEVAREFIPH